jgi:DNA-binding response OmpR family regulator
LLEDHLEARVVATTGDGLEAVPLVKKHEPDLVILDLGLPDGSGLDLLKQWRKEGHDLQVLILTARDTWEDKVVGLEEGADDYLTKPFHEPELIARIKALLRRKSGSLSRELTLNGVSLDEANQCVRVDGGNWHSLTGTEFLLLRYFMHHPDRILSKEHLLNQLYALEQDAAASNLIEVYIARLRRHVGKAMIQNRRGQGYIFVTR